MRAKFFSLSTSPDVFMREGPTVAAHRLDLEAKLARLVKIHDELDPRRLDMEVGL